MSEDRRLELSLTRYYVYSLDADGWHRNASVYSEQIAQDMADAIRKANPEIIVEVVESEKIVLK